MFTSLLRFLEILGDSKKASQCKFVMFYSGVHRWRILVEVDTFIVSVARFVSQKAFEKCQRKEIKANGKISKPCFG